MGRAQAAVQAEFEISDKPLSSSGTPGTRVSPKKNLDTHNFDTLLSLSLRNGNLALRKRLVTIG